MAKGSQDPKDAEERRSPPMGSGMILGPDGRPAGQREEKPRLMDSRGEPIPEPEKPDEEAQEEAQEPQEGLDDPEEASDQGPEDEKAQEAEEDREARELQKQVDPLDHAIAELLMLRPGITNQQIGDQVGLSMDQVYRRRKRPIFLRYMIWLRKPGIEIIRSAEKKAAQRLHEALDATQGTGKSRRPDWWIRIAAARHITDMTIGRKGVLQLEDNRAEIPGVPQEELPELAKSLVTAYQKAGAITVKRLNAAKPKEEQPKEG